MALYLQEHVAETSVVNSLAKSQCYLLKFQLNNRENPFGENGFKTKIDFSFSAIEIELSKINYLCLYKNSFELYVTLL